MAVITSPVPTFITSRYPYSIVSGRASSIVKGWAKGTSVATLDSEYLIEVSELSVIMLSRMPISVDFSPLVS